MFSLELRCNTLWSIVIVGNDLRSFRSLRLKVFSFFKRLKSYLFFFLSKRKGTEKKKTPRTLYHRGRAWKKSFFVWPQNSARHKSRASDTWGKEKIKQKRIFFIPRPTGTPQRQSQCQGQSQSQSQHQRQSQCQSQQQTVNPRLLRKTYMPRTSISHFVGTVPVPLARVGYTETYVTVLRLQ